jgi:hypothetical protein
LSKGVGAKSADTVDSEGKVNLMIVIKLMSLCLVHEAADHAIKFDGTKIGHPFNWNQVATQADHRGATKGEMQVGGRDTDSYSQESVEFWINGELSKRSHR